MLRRGMSVRSAVFDVGAVGVLDEAVEDFSAAG